jgi:hypothetical protein
MNLYLWTNLLFGKKTEDELWPDGQILVAADSIESAHAKVWLLFTQRGWFGIEDLFIRQPEVLPLEQPHVVEPSVIN